MVVVVVVVADQTCFLSLQQLELAVTYALSSQCPNADLHQQAIR